MSVPAGGDAHVELRSVRVAFGTREVFRDLSCRFPQGRITVLMGGSGSGKSTILRLIGGLIRPSGGVVSVAGQNVAELREGQMALVRQRLGMLFQNGALLDSMTIFDNVALPLREHTALGPAEVADAVHRRLASVGLSDVDELLPGELSGGMVRRAALARAIVMDPEILLCDEPFSGLDPPNVRRIEKLLVDLNRDLGLTMIVTGHDPASALRIANHVIVLLDERSWNGSPEQLGASRDDSLAAFLSGEPFDAVPGPGAAGAD